LFPAPTMAARFLCFVGSFTGMLSLAGFHRLSARQSSNQGQAHSAKWLLSCGGEWRVLREVLHSHHDDRLLLVLCLIPIDSRSCTSLGPVG
jgi:hypothetical protein